MFIIILCFNHSLLIAKIVQIEQNTKGKFIFLCIFYIVVVQMVHGTNGT